MSMLPGAALEGLLGAFSRDGRHLALVSPDGRISVHDAQGTGVPVDLVTATGATANGGGHLAEQCLCIAWGELPAAGKKKASTPVLAVGMQSGSVRAYDCRRNELLWTVSDCHEGGVTGLTFSTADGGSFLACGPDAQVSVISVAKGAVGSRFKAGSRGLSAIAATPDGSRVLAASSSVAVYERDGTRRSKFTGHPAPVKAAAVTPDGSFAVTAASGELSASVWDLSKRKGSSSCTLPLPDPASHLAISERTAEGFLCAALVQSGQLIVFRVTAGSDAVQASQLAWITPKGAPGKGAKAGAGGPVVAARVQGSPASAHVAHGAPLRPTLTKVPCESASGEPAGLVTLHASGGVVETPSAAPARGPGADKTILGVDNAGMAAALRPAVGKRGRAEEGEGSDGGDGEDDDDEEEEEEEDEQLREREATLGERVAALEREMQMGLGVSGGSGGGEEEEEEEDGGVAGQRVQEAVRADSLGVLLTQALRAGDNALLERVFNVSQQQVVTNTVRSLLPSDAALFLRAAVARLLSKPRRALQLTRWLRALLLAHAGYLMSAPGSQAALSSLYQAIEARTALHRGFLALHGRLELVAASVPQEDDRAPIRGPLVEVDEAELKAMAELEGEDSEGSERMEDGDVSDDGGSGSDSDVDMSEDE